MTSFAIYTDKQLSRQRTMLVNSLCKASSEDRKYMLLDIDAIDFEMVARETREG